MEQSQPTMLLNLFLSADDNTDRKVALYRRILTRMLDKALDEYKESRECILSQIAEMKRPAEEMERTGRHIYMFKFVDHMENCLCTIRRILRFLEKLKSDVKAPGIPRIKRKQIESLSVSLVDVRNVIEHIDEKIQKDGIKENEPVMLKLTADQEGVCIGSKAISFLAISSIIKKVHELTTEMITCRIQREA